MTRDFFKLDINSCDTKVYLEEKFLPIVALHGMLLITLFSLPREIDGTGFTSPPSTCPQYKYPHLSKVLQGSPLAPFIDKGE